MAIQMLKGNLEPWKFSGFKNLSAIRSFPNFYVIRVKTDGAVNHNLNLVF